MKLRHVAALSGIGLAAVGTGFLINSFLPRRLSGPDELSTTGAEIASPQGDLPNIDVTILRCGSVTIAESFAVRGGSLLAPRRIAHSAVLVRHPRGTFLYDTGLCQDIDLFMMDQALSFRKTLGSYTLEQPISSRLAGLGLKASDLDFVILSHLHWDHVSGIPDLPGVPLRVNRVEYDAARQWQFAQQNGLVPRLMGRNPLTFFDCAGPAYEGFRSSYDLFGDGSIMLVPLPGHTAGQVGMFINRGNGSRVFLLGDAAWVAENYLQPTTMHPFLWWRVTRDDATGRQTLLALHHFARRHPEVPLIAMHDAQMQEAFTKVEQARTMHAQAQTND